MDEQTGNWIPVVDADGRPMKCAGLRMEQSGNHRRLLNADGTVYHTYDFLPPVTSGPITREQFASYLRVTSKP